MIRLTVLITFCITLAGCSTKFVYNNMDWFLVEYLEGYVELNDSQEELMSHKISLLTEWHRREEIPNYIQHLDDLLAIDPQAFTLDDLKQHEERFRTHSRRLLERLSPDITLIAQQLDDDQADELMDSIRVKHMEYREKYQDLSEREIREIYLERIEDNMEMWIGSLTDQQKGFVESWSQDVYVTTHDWTGYQTQIRVQLDQLLRDRMLSKQFQLQLNQIMLNPDRFYDDGLASKIAHNRSVADGYLIQLINSMTEKQTEHYREELSDWRELALKIST